MLLASAFFIACLHAPALAAPATVTAVFDGDTIRLDDQRIVRLIGIDTPELGRDGKPGEPFARAAKKRLEKLLGESDFSVELVYDKEHKDRYQRTLAYLRLVNGSDPATILLGEGLAHVLVLPPNTSRAAVYAAAERSAIRQHRGIWSHKASQPLQAAALTGSETGHHHVTGEVTTVETTPYNHWITLDRKLTVKLTRADAEQNFQQIDIRSLAGSVIEISGNLYRHRGQQRLRLRHPASLLLKR